jgi:hypothetical protein
VDDESDWDGLKSLALVSQDFFDISWSQILCDCDRIEPSVHEVTIHALCQVVVKQDEGKWFAYNL